jgi:hypothetical protein
MDAKSVLKHNYVKLPFLNISVVLLLLLSIIITGPICSSILSFAQEENKKQIILTAILDDLGQIGKKKDGSFYLEMLSVS